MAEESGERQTREPRDVGKIAQIILSKGYERVISVAILAAATLLVASLFEDQSGSRANTSKVTTVEPANYYDSINTKAAIPPYYPANGPHGISAIVDCGFSPDPHSKNMIIDTNDYASYLNPMINRLSTGGRPNSVAMREVDHYINAVDVGWSSGFYVTVTGDTVKIGGAVDGRDLPAQTYKDPSSPDGSFSLPPGNYATGTLGLMDYSFEDLKGQFYMQVQCDSQKTEQLLAYDNNPNT